MVLPSPLEVTSIDYQVWCNFLALHPHPDALWVLNGIKFGFDLGCLDGSPVLAQRNCPSANAQSRVIHEYLKEEILHGSIAGPFQCPPIKNLHINRFGVIPKSTPGKWRLITDLSFPPDESVNSLIPDSAAEVRYMGIQEAVDKLMLVSPGALMAKFDIKRACGLLPVNTNDRSLLGMKWKNKCYIDLQSLTKVLDPYESPRFSEILSPPSPHFNVDCFGELFSSWICVKKPSLQFIQH